MQVRTLTAANRPLTASNGTPSRPAEEAAPEQPKDQVELRFKSSSNSLRRDALWGLALVGTRMLQAAPWPWLGPTTGAVVGGLAAVSGFGELREGISRSDVKEVLDGAAHMLTGAVIVAAGATPLAATGLPVLTAGLCLLGGKALLDHPGEALGLVGGESWQATKDAGAAIKREASALFSSHSAPEKAPEKAPEATDKAA
ncbi:MAG: hypothetical protein HY319_11540 [Armatimonadetes bacterium]|nr:hypothetical protein [Armatimonadota bacterium]